MKNIKMENVKRLVDNSLFFYNDLYRKLKKNTIQRQKNVYNGLFHPGRFFTYRKIIDFAMQVQTCVVPSCTEVT